MNAPDSAMATVWRRHCVSGHRFAGATLDRPLREVLTQDKKEHNDDDDGT
jgi:hypothetical protein